MIADLIATALKIYLYGVIAWIIMSWIQVPSSHPLGRLRAFLDRIIYPVILPLRRVIPPIRLGGGALDLSPIVLIIGIQIIIRFL